ncbi:MAG: GLPGLI family protein [Psychroflexus sp.]
MKSILSIYLIIYPIFIFSQNTIIAEYLHTSESSLAKKNKTILVFANQEKAKQVHFKSELNQDYNYGASMNKDGILEVIEKPNEFANTWFYEASSKDIIKSLENANQKFVVYDSGLGYDWKITDKIDNIGGYQVVKAITNFRGRTFTAWFAPSIPIGFGPWKLKGLPGLILKMHDEERKYVWSLTKLSLNEEFPKGSLELNIPKDAKKMTYQEALEMSNQAYDEQQRRRSSKLGVRGGNIKTVRHRDRELERSYEWEKEN